MEVLKPLLGSTFRSQHALDALSQLFLGYAGKPLDLLYSRIGGLNGRFFPQGWGNLGIVNLKEDIDLIKHGAWASDGIKVKVFAQFYSWNYASGTHGFNSEDRVQQQQQHAGALTVYSNTVPHPGFSCCYDIRHCRQHFSSISAAASQQQDNFRFVSQDLQLQVSWSCPHSRWRQHSCGPCMCMA
jgi:hypothetical protein